MPNIHELESRTVAGAAAGNITVTGIKKGDSLIIVQAVNVAAPNRASEFTVTADDTINNTGGTTTATQTLLVMWEQQGGGRAFGTRDALNPGRSGF
jgi:uncharacterized protein YjdB